MPMSQISEHAASQHFDFDYAVRRPMLNGPFLASLISSQIEGRQPRKISSINCFCNARIIENFIEKKLALLNPNSTFHDQDHRV